MAIRTWAWVLLAMAGMAGEIYAQAEAEPAGSKLLAKVTIRDSQGKSVDLPPPNPSKPVNYVKWLNETLGQGMKDNAASQYEEAYRLFKSAGLDQEELEKALTGPWEGLDSVSAWLTANRACLEKFRQATLKRQCYFRPSFEDAEGGDGTTAKRADPRIAEWYFPGKPPPVAYHRRINDALVAEGWQAWKQGNEDRIVENALTLLRSARHMDDQPWAILPDVGSADASVAHDVLRMAMSFADDPDAFAVRLMGKLNAAADPPLDLRQLKGPVLEFALSRDLCQRAFMPGGTPGSWKVSRGFLEFALQTEAGAGGRTLNPAEVEKALAQIGYEATLGEGEDLTRRVQQWLGKPYPESLKDLAAIGEAVRGSKNPLISGFAPNPAQTRIWDERRITVRRATRLIMHLHYYHSKNHAFPAKLDDLLAPDLREIRIDPYSEKDFIYRKEGASFLLYSVAENLKDDGGKHDESWQTGDVVFWPFHP